jgi:hypothetical protein
VTGEHGHAARTEAVLPQAIEGQPEHDEVENHNPGRLRKGLFVLAQRSEHALSP